MIKQVIVMRRDLHMRRGKEIAQGSHSSLASVTNRLRTNGESRIRKDGKRVHKMVGEFTDAEIDWITGRFTKIVVRVDSEEDLLALKRKADEMGVINSLITDAGKTEFGGVPTVTCLSVGPAEEDDVDAITGDLTLY